jgi:hypothetical protein
MSGIVIPGDRSVKQQSFGVCMNIACREKSTDERFIFPVDHDHFCCPKCGADKPPVAGLLAMIHFLIPDRKGPIEGAGGLRYRLACDDMRSYLATATNQEAATGELAAANCVGCLVKAAELKLTRSGQEMLPK